MNTYILLEVGSSARTEFKMKSGSFVETQDAIVVDEIEAYSKEEAYNKLLNSQLHSNKSFDNIIVKQIL